MSIEENKEIDMIDQSYENNKYFIMIYKPNENKEEIEETIKKLMREHFIFDDEKEIKEDVIRIFGKYFVELNKNKCKIIYNNKKYKLKEYFDEIYNNYNQDIKEIKIKLIGINNITNMKKMFHGCIHLCSVSEQSNEYFQQYPSQSYNILSDTCSPLLEDKKQNDTKERKNNTDINCQLDESFYFCYKSTNAEIIKNNYLNNSENILNFNQQLSSNINKIQNISYMFS